MRCLYYVPKYWLSFTKHITFCDLIQSMRAILSRCFPSILELMKLTWQLRMILLITSRSTKHITCNYQTSELFGVIKIYVLYYIKQCKVTKTEL